MNRSLTWLGAAQEWLCTKATEHFCHWLKHGGPDAQQWARYKNRRKSPYLFGYRQPEWMEEMRRAMGRGDEEMVKRIKLDNL